MGTPASTELPQRLREGTRDLHARTERTGFMAGMLAGRITRDGYCALLGNLHALYAALEAALQSRAADPVIARLPVAALRREPALAADLRALRGEGWRHPDAPLPATRAYVQRLQALAGDGSCALVAHAYVRYLGDLHGGQVLRRLVARSLGLQGEAGTRFYDFGSPERVLALRQSLRDALASLPLDGAQVDLVVQEARWAFEQHQRLFEELEPASAG